MAASSSLVPSLPLPRIHDRRTLRAPVLHCQASTNSDHSHLPRRTLLSTAAATSTSLLFHSPYSQANAEPNPAPEKTTPSGSSSAADTMITERVYMDFSVCPTYFRSDRPLGSDLSSCQDPEPLGRVVFGLYGKLLPLTVANFKAMCTSASYKGALVHKLLQGQYFVAGRQGRKDKGEVRPPPDLARNTEVVDPKAFRLRHVKPGTLSLCLSENDDYDTVKLDSNYHNVEFLVTTGPGPCPQLDNENIVFGTVLEGLDIITTIASIPTYKPGERIRLFNDLAELIGDERAQNARAMWNRPLKTVYISDCGEFTVTKPSLPPTLP